MTFQKEYSYDLNDRDLQYFITITQFDGEINNVNISFKFLNDMNYNKIYGDKKSNRYNFNKNLYNQYYQQPQKLNCQALREVDCRATDRATREVVCRATRRAAREVVCRATASSSQLIQLN